MPGWITIITVNKISWGGFNSAKHDNALQERGNDEASFPITSVKIDFSMELFL